jgi:hypothetical protein
MVLDNTIKVSLLTLSFMFALLEDRLPLANPQRCRSSLPLFPSTHLIPLLRFPLSHGYNHIGDELSYLHRRPMATAPIRLFDLQNGP